METRPPSPAPVVRARSEMRPWVIHVLMTTNAPQVFFMFFLMTLCAGKQGSQTVRVANARQARSPLSIHHSYPRHGHVSNNVQHHSLLLNSCTSVGGRLVLNKKKRLHTATALWRIIRKVVIALQSLRVTPYCMYITA